MDHVEINRRLVACAKVCEGIPTEALMRLPAGAFIPHARIRRYSPTKRQAEALAFILRYKAEHDGLSPTVREIAEAMGATSTGQIARFLDALEQRGHITRSKHLPRSITVIED